MRRSAPVASAESSGAMETMESGKDILRFAPAAARSAESRAACASSERSAIPVTSSCPIPSSHATFLEDATAVLRARLTAVVDRCVAEGMPASPLEGQLLRPLVAMAMAPEAIRNDPDHPFWNAVLAVQMAHEASLLHDDIIDEATARRGRPTMAADRGIGQALVHGDHLLATGYQLASRTGSIAFATMFARSIERTIAGEVDQGRLRGQRFDRWRCLEIAEAKSGELIGCALATSECLAGGPDVEEIRRVGRGLGRLYQMLDDLLDYCPSTDTGKPALTDYAQERWTWVLAEAGTVAFGLPSKEIVRLLHGFGAQSEAGESMAAGQESRSTMRRCLQQMHQEADHLLNAVEVLRGSPAPLLSALLSVWLERAESAVSVEEIRLIRQNAGASGCRSVIGGLLPDSGGAAAHLAANSRSFSFAARWLGSAEREKVTRVYTFCRVTDDLVDGLASGQLDGISPAFASPDPSDVLDEWESLARRAYSGERTGMVLVDEVMRDMALANVPFDYAAELIEGMRMDLRGETYATLEELERYTFRVASVVGMWIAELAGVHDPFALERAAGLGHAMQLTNILRDVGEDLRLGRVYLPTDLLHRHGLFEDDLRDMLEGRLCIDRRYRAALEEVMEIAENEYRRAFAALPALPAGMQQAFAAAAGIYRGIHEEIRRNGYDNFSLRAHTSTPRKALLAARAMRELAAARSGRRAIGEAS